VGRKDSQRHRRTAAGMSDHAWTVHRSCKRVGEGGEPASGQFSFFHHRLYSSEKQGPSLEHASNLRILFVSVPFRPQSLSSPLASSRGTCTAPPRPSPPAPAPAPVASKNGRTMQDCGQVGWSACPVRPAYRRVSGARGIGSWSTEREHCGILHY
jgi:hypothetical protein